MTSSIARDASVSGALAVLFVVLYGISGLVTGNQAIGGLVSLIFLPAFVRLLGYLIVGYWIIPALFLASMYLTVTGTYDLGPGYGAEIIMGAFTAVGGPLGVFVASRIGKLEPSLANLTPMRLLLLSLGCSAGNGIFHEMALRLSGFPATPEFDAAYVFVGDLIGTWTIIYLIKTCLTVYGRSMRR